MDKQWKSKVQDILHICQEELKKTTEIGKKMLSASTTNSDLHTAYEELGQIMKNKIEANEIEVDDPKIHEMINLIREKEKTLEEIEQEVRKIKISTGLKDISKEE